MKHLIICVEHGQSILERQGHDVAVAIGIIQRVADDLVVLPGVVGGVDRTVPVGEDFSLTANAIIKELSL